MTTESNPVPAKWVTHRLENNNTEEVLAPLSRFQPLPTPRLGFWPRDCKSPENLTLRVGGI